MEELLQKVKQNLILSHAADDELLKAYITAAVDVYKRQAGALCRWCRTWKAWALR